MPSRLNVRPHIHIFEEPVRIVGTFQTVDFDRMCVRCDCIADFAVRERLQGTQGI